WRSRSVSSTPTASWWWSRPSRATRSWSGCARPSETPTDSWSWPTTGAVRCSSPPPSSPMSSSVRTAPGESASVIA
ncbi:MAG: ATP-binding protein, partial [uncultured Nocardioidaceae bacterium]